MGHLHSRYLICLVACSSDRPNTDPLSLPGSAVSLVINGRTYTATIRPTHEDGRADSIPLSQQVSERDHDNVGGVHVQQRLHLPSGANGTEAVSHTQQARVSGYASRRGSESRSSGRSRLPPPVAILDRAQSSGPVPLHGRRECCTSGSQVTGEDEHVKRLLFAGVPDGTCKEALFSLMQLCSVEGIASVSNVVKNRVVVEFKQEVDITATRERCRQINEICRSGHNITVGTVPAPRHILVTYQLERERVAERAMEAFQWFQPVASKMQSLCSAMLTFKDADGTCVGGLFRIAPARIMQGLGACSVLVARLFSVFVATDDHTWGVPAYIASHSKFNLTKDCCPGRVVEAARLMHTTLHNSLSSDLSVLSIIAPWCPHSTTAPCTPIRGGAVLHNETFAEPVSHTHA
eukprot:scpid86372/ scgid3250/ 